MYFYEFVTILSMLYLCVRKTVLHKGGGGHPYAVYFCKVGGGLHL